LPEFSDLFDRCALQRAFARTAAFDAGANVLCRRVGRELLERLEYLALAPAAVLDLGCGAGVEARQLTRQYPAAQLAGVDVCPELLRWPTTEPGLACLTGDAMQLPLATDSFDLVVSNLLLPWCDTAVVLAECARVLRPGGALAFTSLGPGSLQELRTAWTQVDNTSHVHPLVDMHDLGDALLACGFSEPVLDVDLLTLTYAEPKGLVADLRALGGTNVLADRRRTLTAPGRWARFAQAYARLPAEDDRLPATWEVIFAVAWATGRQVDGQRDAVPVRFDPAG